MDSFKTTYYLPTTLVLYNTIDSDVGLDYLTTATIAVGDMIMSLVTLNEKLKAWCAPWWPFRIFEVFIERRIKSFWIKQTVNCCRQCSIEGDVQVPPLLLGWYLFKSKFLTYEIFF